MNVYNKRPLLFFFFCFTDKTALELSGIILKMACLIREGSLRGMKPRAPLVSKPPSKIFIIPGEEVVQVIAKVCTLFFWICEHVWEDYLVFYIIVCFWC